MTLYAEIAYKQNMHQILHTSDQVSDKRKTARLAVRLTPRVQDMLRRAADIQGRTVSDFAVSSLEEASRKVLAEVEVLRFSLEAQERLADLILNPPKPTGRLRQAMLDHDRLIAESE